MSYRIFVTEAAKQDVRANHRWWSQNRSREQADRWLEGIDAAVQSLKQMPLRFGKAPEEGLLGIEVHQMPFGIGSKPTHRVIYVVADQEVVIYRVRSLVQDGTTEDNFIRR